MPSTVVSVNNEWITLVDAHALLGTATPADDAAVQAMIDSLSALLNNYLGRDLRDCNYSQIIFRPEGSFVRVSNWPLIDYVNEVVITTEGSPVALTDFDIDDNLGIFYHTASGLSFTGQQPKDITIAYRAGYDPIPAELLTIFNTLLTNLNDAGGTATTATGEIKKVSLVGVAAVEFDTSSSVSYSGVDRQSGIPEELKPYTGTLDRYRSESTMGVV